MLLTNDPDLPPLGGFTFSWVPQGTELFNIVSGVLGIALILCGIVLVLSSVGWVLARNGFALAGKDSGFYGTMMFWSIVAAPLISGLAAWTWWGQTHFHP